jgi:hypothetical protein
MSKYDKILWERFGTPIGMMAGQSLVGVRDERSEADDVCPSCNMLSVGGMCGCDEVSEASDVCPQCGMMTVNGVCGCGEECPYCQQMPTAGSCGCSMSGVDKPGLYAMKTEEASEEYLKEASKTCDQCGMNEGMCQCGMNQAEKKGPSKKTAKKILKGTKTFAQKMKKVSGWAEDPAAAAAWMTHKATGKWPSEK